MPTQTTMPELRHGDTGSSVRQLQEQLKALGYDPGPIDGDFGPKTERAVKRFQAATKQPESGVVDAATWTMLGGARIVETAKDAVDAAASALGFGPTAEEFVQLCLQ